MPTGSLIGALNPLKSRTAVPDQLLLPTYQNQLRIIGRHLDVNDYRAICILEVDGGMLVRAANARRHEPELLEFPDDAFPQMVRDALSGRGRRKRNGKHSKLAPTGYEDLLRALGYELDQRLAKTITLHECQNFFFIAGMASAGHGSGSFAPFDMALDLADVKSVLDAAFRRRG
ncbi:MAG: hypothetical protein R3A46_00070 [Thermomicrobiales bacterium]